MGPIGFLSFFCLFVWVLGFGFWVLGFGGVWGLCLKVRTPKLENC